MCLTRKALPPLSPIGAKTPPASGAPAEIRMAVSYRLALLLLASSAAAKLDVPPPPVEVVPPPPLDGPPAQLTWSSLRVFPRSSLPDPIESTRLTGT